MKNITRILTFFLILCIILAGCADKSPVHLPNGAFPDAPYTAIESPPRFYDEYMFELTANDEYGRIYPYLGGRFKNSYHGVSVYGFCDANGRIICEPFYNYIELVTFGDRQYYLCTKNGASMTTPDHVILTSLDGKTIKRFENAYTARDFGEDRFGEEREHFSVKQDDKWGLLDKDLNVVIDFKYDNVLLLSEGLIFAIPSGMTEGVYMDVDENIILRPYASGKYIKIFEDFNSDWMYQMYRIQFKYGMANSIEFPSADYIDKGGNFHDRDENPLRGYEMFTSDIYYRKNDNGVELTINGKMVKYSGAAKCDYIPGYVIINYDNAEWSWSLIDTDFNVCLENQPGRAQFSGDKIKFEIACKYGAVDLDGTVILPTEYESLHLMNGLWKAIKSYDYASEGLFDVDGNIILPMTHYSIWYLADCMYAEKNNISTLISPKGEIILAVPMLGVTED